MLKSRLHVSVLLIVCMLNSGCAAVLIGAGAAAGGAGVIWYKGKLEETVSASVPHVQRAARGALKEMQIPITEDRGDRLTAELRGYLADGKKVWIDAESTGPSTTKITIRVGTFGDKAFSLRIRDAIKRHL